MKKLTSIILTALLAVGTFAFTACNGTTNTDTPDTPDTPDDTKVETPTDDKTDDKTDDETPTDDKTDDKVFVIGISQFGEHGSLDNCRKGFIEGLKEEGFEDGKNIKIDYKNASFDTGNCTTIAQGFVSNGADLICAIATPSAQAAFNAAVEEEIPVVYTAITDPDGAGLTTGGEVTGTSDALPVKAQLELIREMLPDAKKIGILYTTSEPNSLYTIDIYKELAPDYGFEIVDKGVTAAADVPLAIEAILPDVDCISNLTDNTVVGQLDIMLDKAFEAGKPIFGSEIEQVKKGCVAAEGLEYYNLGIQTGKMAAKILKGEAKASEMPFETVTDNYLYVNKVSADELGITLTDKVNERANFVG